MLSPQQQTQYLPLFSKIGDCFSNIAEARGESFRHQITGACKPLVKKREDTDMLCLKLSPATPCLYTVGAGKHAMFVQDQSKLFAWHIGLLYLVGQKTAGSGSNLAEALQIVLDVERQRPDFFVVRRGDVLPNGTEWAYLNVFKRYYAKDFRDSVPPYMPSPLLVAEDLVWLIEQTDERFLRLPR